MSEPAGAPSIERGEIVGEKFRVGAVIGRGGMSVVYEAQHIQLGQHVAVKVLDTVLTASRGAFERALVEAQATARLTSEHLVRVFDVGTTKTGHAYVVMEKLVGVDLAQEIRKGAPAPVGDAVRIALQVCHGLAEAHAAGIVHRDIKPSNLFLATRPDKTVVVKVLDFGLARAESTSPSRKGMQTPMPRMAGTPGYASPEQLTGSTVDARADLWSLGIVLYELVTGKKPFEALNLTDALVAASTLPMPPMTSPYGPVPPRFEMIVRRCLEKDREDRFASVQELADALHPFSPPAYAHYAERVRAVGGPGLHSAGTIRITISDVSPPGTTSLSDTGSISLVHRASHAEVGGANPARLVVASVVGSQRTALRMVLAAAVVAILLVVLLAGRRLPSGPTAPVGSAPLAMTTPSSSSLGPLPPLAVPSAVAAPTVDPAAGRTAPVASPQVATTPVATPRTDAAPPARPTPVRANAHVPAAPVHAGPRAPASPTTAKTAAVAPSGKAPAVNPMTYR